MNDDAEYRDLERQSRKIAADAGRAALRDAEEGGE